MEMRPDRWPLPVDLAAPAARRPTQVPVREAENTGRQVEMLESENSRGRGIDGGFGSSRVDGILCTCVGARTGR